MKCPTGVCNEGAGCYTYRVEHGVIFSPMMGNHDARSFEQATDVDLARAVASAPPGEAGAAEGELYRRLAPRVRLYGLRHTRDEQQAEDLAQEVLLITLEALRHGKLREPDRLVSFVLGTCRLIVRGGRRGERRRRELLDRFGPDLYPDAAVTGTAPDTGRLAGCLERLAERDRSVIVLSFYEERSAPDVGEELGLTAANVRVIRHRALGRLRDCMAPGGSS